MVTVESAAERRNEIARLRAALAEETDLLKAMVGAWKKAIARAERAEADLAAARDALEDMVVQFEHHCEFCSPSDIEALDKARAFRELTKAGGAADTKKGAAP